jgi:hypothetical protein
MKKVNIFIIGIFVIVFFNGCLSTSSKRKPPIREFQTIELSDSSLTDPFIVNEYISDDVVFKKGSVYFSTALFLSDLGIMEDIKKETFEKYVDILFSRFPVTGELKQIIIPNLSFSQDIKETNYLSEKNAYLFIAKNINSVGREYYRIESNIPVASSWTNTYDGYVVRLKSGFYRNIIPAGWAAIMNLYFNKDILVYQGIAYPSKAAPLRFSGTGIGSDIRMASILAEQSTVSDVKNALRDTVDQAITATKIENEEQKASIRFLEKYTNVSLSAYSYIDSDIEDAKKYYLLAKSMEIDIPDNAMGNRYNELEKIMNYLINVIE